MKKVLAIILAVCMVFCFAACGEKKQEESNVIKVGVFEPQTGDNGAGGKQEILGIDYAHSLYPTVELGGKTYNIELVKVDNRTSAENGPSAAAELVNQGVAVVVGSYGSGVSMAGGTVFKEAGIAAIGTSCTNPQVTAGCETYFRVCFTDPFQGPALAAYAYNTLGVKTAYSLGMNGSDYDLGLMHYFKEAFEKLGGKVVEEYFPEGTSNFVSYVNNAKAANAGVIMAPISINYAQLLVDAAAAQGFEGTLLGSDTWDNNQVAQATVGKNVTAVVTTFYQEGGDPTFDKGMKAFINGSSDNLANNGGNDEVAAVTVMGYDAYMAAYEAIKKAGAPDAASILKAMPSASFEGVSGHIEYDSIGDAKRDVAYIKTANTKTGAWEFVTIQKVE